MNENASFVSLAQADPCRVYWITLHFLMCQPFQIRGICYPYRLSDGRLQGFLAAFFSFSDAH